MKYRLLGTTGLMVSEIGLGAEWFERHSFEECQDIINHCEEKGINILDCWMSDPIVRSKIGDAIVNKRNKWIIQGHIGSTWENGQYVRTRKIDKVKLAFNDLLERLHTDYIDLGMIHYVDTEEDLDDILNGDFIKYVNELKKHKVIHHLGLSTHNPSIARRVVSEKIVEVILFSVNPAFDMLPDIENIDDYFVGEYDETLGGISKERAELYRICETNGVAITVMKGFAGGRLLNAESSYFKVPLTPVMCLHYALTRPGVKSVMVGFDNIQQIDEVTKYEEATNEELDYATVLANAPRHAYRGQCTYCGHCQPCPANIDIAMVNKLYDLATIQSDHKVPDSIKGHYNSLNAKASNCIKCGLCEKRCPFGVKIVDKMTQATKLFK